MYMFLFSFKARVFIDQKIVSISLKSNVRGHAKLMNIQVRNLMPKLCSNKTSCRTRVILNKKLITACGYRCYVDMHVLLWP